MTAIGADEIVDKATRLLGFQVTLDDSGRPMVDVAKLPKQNPPGKLDMKRTVVIDTSPSVDGEQWPAPRFEILIANLDSVGISVLQLGNTSCTKLLRANDHFLKDRADKRASYIGQALLWIGMDSAWRFIAAGLGKPQIVIAADKSRVAPRWHDTFVVDALSHAPESKALGPISVTSVATAVSDALKQIGVSAKL